MFALNKQNTLLKAKYKIKIKYLLYKNSKWAT